MNLDDFAFGTAARAAAVASNLGPLARLPGTWTGEGFNVIWRPNSTPGQDHFLELNLTDEVLQFDRVPGPIPNRGLLQPDIDLFGVRYLQRIVDHLVIDPVTGQHAGLHLEPGFWLRVPATQHPNLGPTVVRMALIPHGTSAIAQGISTMLAGAPTFPQISITPFLIGAPTKQVPFPESNLSQPSAFRTPNASTDFSQSMLDDPNSVLTAALAGQTVTSTVVLNVSTAVSNPVPGGGTENTEFLQGSPEEGPNADAALLQAMFWIETVAGPAGGPDIQQLQYSQIVLLNFAGLSWPHVSVATLVKT